jgi:type IV pilus assembly PilX-like protein
MYDRKKHPESGVALFFSIFALLLLTALGAALMFVASTETSINSNYRQEQVAYFAAKAGIEEARARAMSADPNTLVVTGNAAQPLFDPAQVAAPTTSNYMIYYIVNNGAGAATTVQPWNSSNTYYDDELCHDGYTSLGLTATAPGVRCAATTISATTYVSYNSALPFNGTAGALPFKWVRIAPKVNGSVQYLVGTGATATVSTYYVNSTAGASTLICWDGQEEVPLTAATCNLMLNAANAPMTNVYMMTALGVSPTGARKVVQAEVALTPTPPFPYGLFATSTACPALNFNGNNASTNSYTTAGGGTYATTNSNTGGDIGSNGGVNIGNGNIGGLVGVLQPAPSGVGTCATPFQTGPNGNDVLPNGSTSPNGGGAPTYLPQPAIFSTPPPPNPATPNTAAVLPACGGGGGHGHGGGGLCISPGTYGNISVPSGQTLYLSPGTYNINSVSIASNPSTQIVVSPAGAVIINVGGNGQATPIDLKGNGLINDTNPNDFVINYSGTGNVSIAGNGTATAILNAPNATLSQTGNGTWYGSILASTISLGGNAFFHFDRASALAPQNNGYYTLVSYREVAY